MISFGTIRRYLLRISLPLTKLIALTHAPFSRKLIDGRVYFHLRDRLKPGCVLLSRVRGEFSNFFIPGFFSHAAIYTGRETVIEAVTAGVRETDLVTFLTRKDYVVVVDPIWPTESERARAIAWATRQLGKPYDYEIELGYKTFYCFELTYAAYKEACDDGETCWKLYEKFGVKTIVGDDFLNAADKWRVEFDSRAIATPH